MKRRLLLAWVVVPQLALAVKVGDAELPDSWSLKGQTLVLNGAGLREYGLFRIPVYAAALYLPSRQQDEKRILSATTPRVVQMTMLRDVSRADSVKAWDIYLVANCKLPCQPQSDTRQKFLALIPDARAGDAQTFVFADDTLELFRNGKSLGGVADSALTTAVLASWIGEMPTTLDLKKRLLGLQL